MPLEVAAVRPVAFLDGPYAAVPASLLRELSTFERWSPPTEHRLWPNVT